MRHAQVGEFGKFLKRLFHLQSQFARGLEDEAPQLSVRAKFLDDRQRKRRRFARAGLRRSDHDRRPDNTTGIACAWIGVGST